MDEFKKALEAVLVHEGGKVDHPKDPGGRTNCGVTQAVYTRYCAAEKLPPKSVFDMKDAERDAIYKFQYWDQIKGDLLPPGIGYVVFDGAVNSGVSQSVKWLQRALGSLYKGKIDGIMGMLTAEATRAVNDGDALIANIRDRRMAFLQALDTWPTFKNGWTTRVRNVLATGQAWAHGTVGPKIEFVPGGNAKANLEDAKPLPTKGVADAVIGGGVVIAGGAQGIDQMLGDIEGLIERLSQTVGGLQGIALVDQLVPWLTVAGVVVSFVGSVYRLYITNYDKKLRDALDIGVPAKAEP